MGALISIASLAIIMQCIKADQYLPKIDKKCLFGSRKLCHHIINNCKNLFPVCINWIGTFVVVQIFAFCRKCVIHAGRTITPRGISRYCQELCANTTASLMKLVRRRPNRPRACSAWLPGSGPPVVRQGWRSHLRSP